MATSIHSPITIFKTSNMKLIAISTFLCIAYFCTITNATQTMSVSIELLFTNYSNSDLIPAMITRVPQGTKGFGVLQQASQQNPCFRFKYQTFSFGRFITTICCQEQDETASLYWMIYKNGDLSPVGIDDITLEDGDTLTFKYM